MFISKAYYCYHIHQEKISNSETSDTKTNHTGNSSPNFFKKITWITNKKKVFHAMWASFNLALLSLCFYELKGTQWEFIFLVATFIYCSLYWMLTKILLDKFLRVK